MHDISDVEVKNPIILGPDSQHSSGIKLESVLSLHSINFFFRLERYLQFLFETNSFFEEGTSGFFIHA